MDGFRTHKLLCLSALNRFQYFIFTNFLLAFKLYVFHTVVFG